MAAARDSLASNCPGLCGPGGRAGEHRGRTTRRDQDVPLSGGSRLGGSADAYPAVNYGYYDLAARRLPLSRVAGRFAPGPRPMARGIHRAAAGSLPPRSSPAPRAMARKHSRLGLGGDFPDPPAGCSPAAGDHTGDGGPSACGRDRALRRRKRSSTHWSADWCPIPTSARGAGLAAAVRAAGADAETAARVAAVASGCWLAAMAHPGRRRKTRLWSRRWKSWSAPRRFAARLAAARVRAVVLLLGSSRAGMHAQAPRRPRGSMKRGSPAPPRKASPAGPSWSPPSRRTGTTSAPPTTGSAPRAAPTAAWLQAAAARSARADDPPRARLTPPPDVDVRPLDLVAAGHPGGAAAARRRWAGSLGWVGWVLRPRVRERWTVLLVFAARCGIGRARAPRLVPAAHRHRARPDHAATVAARPRAGDRSARGRQRGADAPAACRGWLLVRAAGGREGWVPDDGGRRHRRLDSRHAAPHRHPARRRRRPDRRGRGGGAPGLGGEGAGGERARRRRAPRPGRAGERRQDADRRSATTAAAWGGRTRCSRSTATPPARSGARPTWSASPPSASGARRCRRSRRSRASR